MMKPINRYKIALAVAMLLCSYGVRAQESISLAGEWKLRLDSELTMPVGADFNDCIILPGTTDEAKKGTKSTKSDFGILTREYKYYGKAWYKKDIIIPQEWHNKRIVLELERVMWQSTLFLDGKQVGVRDALNSPHCYELGLVVSGKHEIVICVDNRQIYNIGDKGHLYTEYTQTIWNGVVGKMELRVQPDNRLSVLQVYTTNPSVLRLEAEIVGQQKKSASYLLECTLTERSSGKIVWSGVHKPVGVALRYEASMPDGIKLWDDVSPNLYNLTVILKDKRSCVLDKKVLEVGFRNIESRDRKLYINGRPLFLRGNLDGVHFPLTGYPSCDVDEWERIFRIYKSYGLNNVRFHSWTPPQAAFTAANRVGILVQSEVLWLDRWMTVAQPDRPEMYTNGLPGGLGHNHSAEEFAKAELQRMIDWYGNNPSFAMMCIGNELGSSDFQTLESYMKPYRDTDNRRLYASSSARKINPSDQYAVTHYLEEIGPTRGFKGGASLDWDFEDTYSKADIPVIAHEIGQWPVYPRWSEIKKYTGVLKAMNFEEFAEQASDKNEAVYDMNAQFADASGALNQLMYKYEIESFLRTPSCAGIHLLGMQDYQGQGEALIGWLDVFYDSKGITTPEKFRQHHDTTVLLLRLPKFTYSAHEPLSANVQIAHWGVKPITDTVVWKVSDRQGRVVDCGEIVVREILCGSSEIAGRLSADLSRVMSPSKLTITLSLKNRYVENSWDIWVYPPIEKSPYTNVMHTDKFDVQTIKYLERGGRVVLDASALGNERTADALSFYPLYWSLTFFPGQQKNTLGLVVDNQHAALSQFPTDNHSDWQWETIYKGSKGFYINDFNKDYRPIAQPVDDFHRNNFVASIFELKVGNGSLLVCGFPLSDSTNLVAAQLKESLMDYVASNLFEPDYEIAVSILKDMFATVDTQVNRIPKELEGAILHVEAAALHQPDGSKKWEASMDRVNISEKCSYEVNGAQVWRDGGQTAWQGVDFNLIVRCPKGFIGSLYVYLPGLNKKAIKASLNFEGREQILGELHNGKWVKLHVMREDSNKGFVTFKVRSANEESVMISQLALIAE